MTNAAWWQRFASIVFLATAACASAGPSPAAEEAKPETAPPPSAAAATPEPAPVAPEPVVAVPAIIPVDPATAPQPAPINVPKDIQVIVDAKDRSTADRALDPGRHPGELLAFFGVKPGMKVAEIVAATGYTTELLARAVGKKGLVYGQNHKVILEKFVAAPWAERLAKPVNKHVVRVDRELDDPLPPEAKQLDMVFSVLVYHDTAWLGVDRAKMNAAIFAALKPGGVYAVVDHSGRTGTGSTEAQTFHRIEEALVREEIERAGFKLAGEAHFLRNPQDTRDWNDSPMAAEARRGTSDRFVLRFVKPE